MQLIQWAEQCQLDPAPPQSKRASGPNKNAENLCGCQPTVITHAACNLGTGNCSIQARVRVPYCSPSGGPTARMLCERPHLIGACTSIAVHKIFACGRQGGARIQFADRQLLGAGPGPHGCLWPFWGPPCTGPVRAPPPDWCVHVDRGARNIRLRPAGWRTGPICGPAIARSGLLAAWLFVALLEGPLHGCWARPPPQMVRARRSRRTKHLPVAGRAAHGSDMRSGNCSVRSPGRMAVCVPFGRRPVHVLCATPPWSLRARHSCELSSVDRFDRSVGHGRPPPSPREGRLVPSFLIAVSVYPRGLRTHPPSVRVPILPVLPRSGASRAPAERVAAQRRPRSLFTLSFAAVTPDGAAAACLNLVPHWSLSRFADLRRSSCRTRRQTRRRTRPRAASRRASTRRWCHPLEAVTLLHRLLQLTSPRFPFARSVKSWSASPRGPTACRSTGSGARACCTAVGWARRHQSSGVHHRVAPQLPPTPLPLKGGGFQRHLLKQTAIRVGRTEKWRTPWRLMHPDALQLATPAVSASAPSTARRSRQAGAWCVRAARVRVAFFCLCW